MGETMGGWEGEGWTVQRKRGKKSGAANEVQVLGGGRLRRGAQLAGVVQWERALTQAVEVPVQVTSRVPAARAARSFVGGRSGAFRRRRAIAARCTNQSVV